MQYYQINHLNLEIPFLKFDILFKGPYYYFILNSSLNLFQLEYIQYFHQIYPKVKYFDLLYNKFFFNI
jgi:hypothetical protein